MNLTRKDFIKLSSITSIAAFLNSCGLKTDEEKQLHQFIEDTLTKNTSVEVLKNATSNNVIYLTKESDDYELHRVGFCKRINNYPSIIALCLNANGVKEAILYAKQNTLPIAIKSGGHCFEDFSTNENGLVINLSQLKSFSLNSDFELIIGAGYKLGEVYDKLLEQNRIIPAGSCSGVGISGLTLGGGYGLFSREFGLTCDSLLEAELVTADGEIITTQNNPDLLWALKGGGNGTFGVITQLRFKTHQAPSFLQSTRFKSSQLTVDRAKILLKTWFEVAAQLPNHCFSAFVLNGKSLTILITNTHQQNADLLSLFDKLSAISDKTKIGNETPIKPAIDVFKGQQNPIFFKNASVGLYRSFDDISQVIDAVLEKVINGKGLIYQINTLGGNINHPDFEKASCYPYRELPFLSELQSYWSSDKKTNEQLEKFNAIQQLFFDAGINKQYVNYPAIENPDYETAYYAHNLEKLKKIKKAVDSDNFFKHAQSITL